MDVLRRANELQNVENKDVLHLEVGQPETGAPKRVAQAAVEALTSTNPPQVLGYTDAFGLIPLRQCIVDHYQSHYLGQTDNSVDGDNSDATVSSPLTQLSTNQIVITTGSSGGFLLAFTACFDSGDVVGIASSGYPCYRNILSALGCQLATIPINDEFKVTSAEVRAEVERRRQAGDVPMKGLILSSPSNPTGAMLSPSELKELCEYCDQQSIRFLSDEIYHGITYGSTQEATALQYSSSAIIINSFSKFYSMSGWRLGWMVLPTSMIDPINRLQQNMFINAPTISQTAALQCWHPETLQELRGHVEKYRTSRELILQQLSKFDELDPKNIAPADGGFYIYVDLGEDNIAPGLGSVNLCEELLETQYIAFTPGVDFEDPLSELGNRRLRISYSGGVEAVRTAMDRLAQFWPTWIERVRAAQQNQL
jgi:aspartate/methionine/tyrosine aminotransferase